MLGLNNDLDMIFYILIIIIYIILFSFLFKSKMEGLIFILLFIITFLSSLKLIADLYLDTKEDGKGIMHLNISNLNGLINEIPPLKFLFNFLFGGASIIVIILLLMIGILMYIYKVGNKDFIIFSSITISAIFLGYFLKNDQQASYYILYAVPIILLLTSLILVFIVMNKFKDKSIMGRIKLSNRNRERLKKYKEMFVSIIVLIILSLVGMLSFSSSTNTDEMKGYVDYFVTLLLLIIYGLSGYVVYETNEIFVTSSK